MNDPAQGTTVSHGQMHVWGLVVDLKELSREDKRTGSLELVPAAVLDPLKKSLCSSLVELRQKGLGMEVCVLTPVP